MSCQTRFAARGLIAALCTTAGAVRAGGVAPTGTLNISINGVASTDPLFNPTTASGS